MKRRFIMIACAVFLIAATAAFAFKLPDTGQTKCYGLSGFPTSTMSEIDCAGTGQDGAYNTNPMSYSNNGNGTVTDNNTGLMWQKCSVGQNNDSTCSGGASLYNWYRASATYNATYNPSSQDVCGSLGTGWRLPTKKELMSIVDYSPYPGPTINATYFPNTVALEYTTYWSSTTDAYVPDYAGDVSFRYGFVGRGHFKSDARYVRCVLGEEHPQHSFLDNGDGTVSDNTTGLIWQQAELGTMTWDSALSYCEGLTLGGRTDWWLPNIKELESITDDTSYGPSIDTSFFPNAFLFFYWSSTTSAFNTSRAWTIGLNYGDALYWSKTHGEYVRCVSGGQSGSFGNLEVSPASYDFGAMPSGTCGSPQEFILSNTGNGDIAVSNIYLSDTANFALILNSGANPCAVTNPVLAPGSSCTVAVSFCPTAGGSIMAILTVASNDPTSPTFNMPISGMGALKSSAKKKGRVVLIDGIKIMSILDSDYPNAYTHYLYDAIAPYWKQKIQAKGGSVSDFIWSNTMEQADQFMLVLSALLEKYTRDKNQDGTSLTVVAHSWGTVLSYIAIKGNSNIFVDKFITLGSPLNAQAETVSSITKAYLEESSIDKVENLPNIKQWHNYWASCDPISGGISSLKSNSNIKIKTSYIDEETLVTCHGAYYEDDKVWNAIMIDVLATVVSGKKQK